MPTNADASVHDNICAGACVRNTEKQAPSSPLAGASSMLRRARVVVLIAPNKAGKYIRVRLPVVRQSYKVPFEWGEVRPKVRYDTEWTR